MTTPTPADTAVSPPPAGRRVRSSRCPLLLALASLMVIGCERDPFPPVAAGHGNVKTQSAEGEGNAQSLSQFGSRNEQVASVAGNQNVQAFQQRGDENVQVADASGDWNHQFLSQEGTGNSQSTAVTGDWNRQDHSQAGDANEQSTASHGEENEQSASQQGERGSQELAQSGEENEQQAEAVGDEHSQELSQEGVASVQIAVATGARKHQLLSQEGVGNRQTVHSNGEGGRVRAIQEGTGLRMEVEQNAPGVSLVAGQEGEESQLTVRGHALSGPLDERPVLSFRRTDRLVSSRGWAEWELDDGDLGGQGTALAVYLTVGPGATIPILITVFTSDDAYSEAWVKPPPVGSESPTSQTRVVIARFSAFEQSDAAAAPTDFASVRSIRFTADPEGMSAGEADHGFDIDFDWITLSHVQVVIAGPGTPPPAR